MDKPPRKTGHAAIDNLVLRDIVAVVRKRRRWSPATAREAEGWYRTFLALSYKRGGTAVFGLDKRADYIWHEHITSTRRYREDCEKIFGEGKFLDHTPGTPKNAAVLLEQSMADYDNEYGIHPLYAGTCCF